MHSAFCLRAWGQDYAIDWYTIDGGGGESTDGYYALTGTIGQPDAGELTDAYYAIVGGFWAVGTAVPAPGAPGLTIHRTSTNAVVVSWPASAQVGGTLQAIVSPAEGTKLYRLKRF